VYFVIFDWGEWMGLSDLDYYDAFSNARLTFPTFRNDENFSSEDLKILHSIASARSAKQCNEAFALATRRFGNDAFACGEVDVRNRNRVVFFAMEWSEVWRKFYLESYLNRDPMLHLLEQADEPFTWGEWKDSKRLTAEERDALVRGRVRQWFADLCGLGNAPLHVVSQGAIRAQRRRLIGPSRTLELCDLRHSSGRYIARWSA
jgi:hypothetical protein